jgi:hypothetical protein
MGLRGYRSGKNRLKGFELRCQQKEETTGREVIPGAIKVQPNRKGGGKN